MVAETEELPCDEEFVQELTARELASQEDGLVSAVDLQILAWVIRGQRSIEERAFNRTAFQRLGGLEGLLERFLSRALEVRETEARRQAALKVLLALTDLERNARAGVLSPEEIQNRLARTMPFGEVQETLEWLARSDVRLATPVEREDGRGYELAHERLIPALRRLAGRELSAADQANQLLDRRVNEWLGNDRARRYLLTWRDWRRIRRHRPFLEWGTRKRQKEALLAETRQYWRRCAGAAALLVLLLLSAVALWFSSWGQIWLVKRELGSLIGSVGDDAAHQAAVALYKTGAFEWARQTADGIGDPRGKVLALNALAGAAAEMRDPAKATVLFEQARQTADGIGDARDRVWAEGHLAEAAAKIADPVKAAALIEQARRMADGIADPRDKALTLGDLAEAAATIDPAKFPLLMEQARQTVERMGDPGGKARTFRDLAAVAARLKDPAKAAALMEQARQAVEEIGDPRARSWEFTELALYVMNTGDVAKAAALVEQARQAAEEISEPKHKADRLKGVAGAKGMVGAWTAGVALLDESRQVADEIGDPRDKALTLGGLAEAAATMKNPTKAAVLMEQARQAADGIGDRWDKARTLVILAEVTERIGDPARAAVLREQARQAGDLGDTASTTSVPKDLTWLLLDHDPVERFARSGAWRRARQWAHRYTFDDRARALATILEVWAEGGNPGLGSRPKGR